MRAAVVALHYIPPTGGWLMVLADCRANNRPLSSGQWPNINPLTKELHETPCPDVNLVLALMWGYILNIHFAFWGMC